MEARLTHHSATPNRTGNHFNLIDQASRRRIGDPLETWNGRESEKARLERILRCMESYARSAGRHMATDVLFRYRSLPLQERPDFEMLVRARQSAWLKLAWKRFQVSEVFEELAEAVMRQSLAAKGLPL